MAKKAKPKFKTLSKPETWEEGRKVSEAVILERDDGTKGISVRMGTKARYGKTLWIDKELDLPSWLRWFLKTVQKLYFKLFGEKVSIPHEEVEYYKDRTEKLTEELTKTRKKLEDAEEREESAKQTLALAHISIGNLDSFQKVFEEFKKEIEESVKGNKGAEEKVKTKILENPWLLGLECQVDAKNKNVDTQTQIDLHVRTKFNQDRIFEVKSPNVKPIVRKENKEGRRPVISPELADGLSELVLYMRKTDIYSSSKSEGVLGIQKASGFILAGYNLQGGELELLKELNFNLQPHILIITYNDILENIKNELDVIKALKKNTTKKENARK